MPGAPAVIGARFASQSGSPSLRSAAELTRKMFDGTAVEDSDEGHPRLSAKALFAGFDQIRWPDVPVAKAKDELRAIGLLHPLDKGFLLIHAESRAKKGNLGTLRGHQQNAARHAIDEECLIAGVLEQPGSDELEFVVAGYEENGAAQHNGVISLRPKGKWMFHHLINQAAHPRLEFSQAVLDLCRAIEPPSYSSEDSPERLIETNADSA